MGLAADDIARSLRGSWRLMNDGAAALSDLDLSRGGFWRSFLALALMLPATIALLAATRIQAGLSTSAGLFASPELVAVVLGALLLAILVVPAFLVALRPELAREGRFTSFVIAWNWAGIVSASLMAVPAAVFALGWSTPDLAAVQALAFGLIVLRLRYGAARATFGDGGAALLIALSSLLLDYGVARLFGLA